MRKKLLGGLVALALVLAPAAAANAETYPPQPGELHGTIDRNVVKPGETVTYTASAGTFDANENVVEKVSGLSGASITLVSTVSDASFTKAAAADGSLTFAITMPADGDKQYSLNVYRADGRLWDPFVITVVPDAAVTPGDNSNAGGSTGGLAKTGSDIAIYSISGLAVLLLAAGVVLLVVRRRRAGADSAA